MRAMHPSEEKRMLHDILWNGLRKDLKDASGHKYDSIKDFDSLRVASLRCLAPYNSLSISTPLAALPYMLSSMCSNSSLEVSGPSRITTAPACPRSDKI
jgi:hypothetical protein